MPQAIALALLGVGLYAGYRWFTSVARGITLEMQRDEGSARGADGRIEKDLGALEYDKATGVYRPARKP